MAILRLCLAVVFCGHVLDAASMLEKSVFMSNEHANSFLRKKRGTTPEEEAREDAEDLVEWPEEVSEINAWLEGRSSEYPTTDPEEGRHLVEETDEILADDFMNQVIIQAPRKANLLAHMTSESLDSVNNFVGIESTMRVRREAPVLPSKGVCLSNKLKKKLQELIDETKDIVIYDILPANDIKLQLLEEMCMNIASSCACFSKTIPPSTIKTESQALTMVWESLCPVIRYNGADLPGTETLLETFTSTLNNYCAMENDNCNDGEGIKIKDDNEVESGETKAKNEIKDINNKIQKLNKNIKAGEPKLFLDDCKDLVELYESLGDQQTKLKGAIATDMRNGEAVGDLMTWVEQRAADLQEVHKQCEKTEIRKEQADLILQGKLEEKAIVQGNVEDQKTALGKMSAIYRKQAARNTKKAKVQNDIADEIDRKRDALQDQE